MLPLINDRGANLANLDVNIMNPTRMGGLGRSPSVSPRDFKMARSPSNESLQNALRGQNSYTTLPATYDHQDRGLGQSGSVSFLSPVITAARNEVTNKNFGFAEA